jgi:hypothetical protein
LLLPKILKDSSRFAVRVFKNISMSKQKSNRRKGQFKVCGSCLQEYINEQATDSFILSYGRALTRDGMLLLQPIESVEDNFKISVKA